MELQARIDRLEEALSRLAEAQARTEERVGRLEGRMDRVEAALARLAEAQARTEERVGRLEAAVQALAAAQARTEATVQTLAQQVGRLETAQARTEATVQTLAQRVDDLAQQVGRLGDTIGFTLEDLAREVTPAYLAQHYGMHVLQLDRHFVRLDGQELELDLYGEGRRNSEVITVVGEVRSRIYGRDVEDTVRRVARLAPQLPGTPVTVLFGFVIHPSARDVAQRLGAIVISSSGR